MKLRVDWEPSRGTNGEGVFPVQSGSGKSGYNNVDAHLDINEITDIRREYETIHQR